MYMVGKELLAREEQKAMHIGLYKLESDLAPPTSWSR